MLNQYLAWLVDKSATATVYFNCPCGQPLEASLVLHMLRVIIAVPDRDPQKDRKPSFCALGHQDKYEFGGNKRGPQRSTFLPNKTPQHKKALNVCDEKRNKVCFFVRTLRSFLGAMDKHI